METVYTVWDFYDGPRTGLADYHGLPHYFSCQWDDAADEYGNVFSLSPIDAETLSIALEQWAIWRKWEFAFHSGDVPLESHPGQKGRDPQYDELEITLRERLAALPHATCFAYAKFHALPEQNIPMGAMRQLLVQWMDTTNELTPT